MHMKPDKTRPPKSIGRTCGSRSAFSRLSAPTRIISARPVMPQHILPLTRNDRPPTIFFSTTSSRPDSSRRTREAASGSKLKRPVPRFVIRPVPSGSSCVEGVDDVGVLGVHDAALELEGGGEFLGLGGPFHRQQAPPLDLLHPGQPFVGGGDP